MQNRLFPKWLLGGFVCLLLGLVLSGCSSDGKPGVFSPMGYHVGPTKVWLKSPESGMQVYSVHEVVGADAKTFQTKTLTNKYGVGQLVGFDAQNVFWGFERVDGADLESFEYVGSEYFKDKNHGYHYARSISDDAKNFELYDEFARDSRNVYYAGGVFSADAANFVRVGSPESRYYKDRQHCWYFISPMTGADPATLRSLGDHYAADQTHVFYQMNTMDEAILESFQFMKHEYARDSHSVFFQSERIDGADPTSFRILDERYALDKSHCYYYGCVIENASPSTFQQIDEFYTKDADHVWLNGTLVDGADSATFEVISGPGGKSRDAKNEYEMYERVQNGASK